MQVVAGIADTRKLAEAAVRRALDSAPYTAGAACNAGLIDIARWAAG